MNLKNYTITRASLLSGAHVNTINNYIRAGVIKPERLSDGTRIFGDEDVQIIRDRVQLRRRKAHQ